MHIYGCNILPIFYSIYMWPAERKPGTSCKYWIWDRGNFIRTGRFPAKLRLLHQCVTGGLDSIVLNYEARVCYYNDDISSNSQAGPWNTGTRCYGQLVRVFGFTSFQSVCGCLSVHRHNVSLRFHNRWLSQLSLPTFKLRTCVNLRDTIVYGDIKIYRSSVRTLRFLEKLLSASATHFAL